MKGAQILPFHMAAIGLLGFEIPLGLRPDEEVGEPLDDRSRYVGERADEILKDLLDQVREREIIRGVVSKRRLASFRRTDSVLGERMEGPGLDRHPGAGLDPFRHLRGGVLGEGRNRISSGLRNPAFMAA